MVFHSQLLDMAVESTLRRAQQNFGEEWPQRIRIFASRRWDSCLLQGQLRDVIVSFLTANLSDRQVDNVVTLIVNTDPASILDWILEVAQRLIQGTLDIDWFNDSYFARQIRYRFRIKIQIVFNFPVPEADENLPAGLYPIGFVLVQN